MGFRSVSFKRELDVRKFAHHYHFIKTTDASNTLDNNIKRLTSALVVATNGRTYEVTKIKNLDSQLAAKFPIFFLTKSGERKPLAAVQQEACYDKLIHNKPLAEELCQLNYKPGKLLFSKIIEVTCPILHTAALQPVITKRGDTFEYSAIQEWLKSNKNHPVVLNDPLTENEIVINDALQNLISVSYLYRQQLLSKDKLCEAEINQLTDEREQLIKQLVSIQQSYLTVFNTLTTSNHLSVSAQLRLISLLNTKDLTISVPDTTLIHFLNTSIVTIHHELTKPDIFKRCLIKIDSLIDTLIATLADTSIGVSIRQMLAYQVLPTYTVGQLISSVLLNASSARMIANYQSFHNINPQLFTFLNFFVNTFPPPQYLRMASP